MDSQERDALREKHRDWSGHCPACDYQSHPCDVIKVLDATEPAATECDHIFIANPTSPLRIAPTFPYCPKCGEKL